MTSQKALRLAGAGEHRPDAGSAATTPVMEGLPPREPRRQQRVPAMHARPSPSSTLRPFSIVKARSKPLHEIDPLQHAVL